MNWQPIETAPRDGTEILLYVGTLCHDYGVAWWNGEWWEMGSRECAGMKDRFDVEFGAPTHWMPLPEPPEDKNDE